jgi:hypothetical protein
VEVADVLDGTVSLALANENVEEVERVWLEPENVRRIAEAMLNAADEIEARRDCDGD